VRSEKAMDDPFLCLDQHKLFAHPKRDAIIDALCITTNTGTLQLKATRLTRGIFKDRSGSPLFSRQHRAVT
jgi:hypothetical protein